MDASSGVPIPHGSGRPGRPRAWLPAWSRWRIGTACCLLAALPVEAAPPLGALEPVTLERPVALAPVTSTELFGGPPEWAVAVPEGDLGPPISYTVVRRMPDLWQLRVFGDVRPEDLDVTYELVSGSGRQDRLSHREHPESEIRVRILPAPPHVVRTERDGAVVQGGAVLELDVAGVRAAGHYQGTITITVVEL